MNVKLPCEIIRDLLPSYIDGLESDVTKQAVEVHLSECTECSRLCEAMKKENVPEVNSELEQNTAEEKVILHKIKRKMNRKVKIAIGVGITAVILAVGILELLFNAVVREIPRQEVEVTATVYNLKDITITKDGEVAEYGYDYNDGTLISIENTDDETEYFEITIPDMPNADITITKDIMDNYDSLTVVKWKSPYFLRAILWDIEETDGERIMYIRHYKTTILNNTGINSGSYTNSIDFGALDKIVYVEKDGTETVLWENQ